jgi:hypothetical protein
MRRRMRGRPMKTEEEEEGISPLGRPIPWGKAAANAFPNNIMHVICIQLLPAEK